MKNEEPDLKKLFETAQLDQAEAGIVNLARLLAMFYQELRKQGVPDETAEWLVRDYFETIRGKM